MHYNITETNINVINVVPLIMYHYNTTGVNWYHLFALLQYCWDIADIEFLWVVGGVVCKLSFMSNLTKVMLGWGWAELGLSWGFDNIYYLLQNCVIKYETAEW